MYLLMEIEYGDSKGIDRWGMLRGLFPPSTSGIGYRTFLQILVLTLGGHFTENCFFFKFLDEIKSNSKHLIPANALPAQ